ncbi:hypothetical protein HDU92_007668, partial [Lobulomyces angularis]
MIRPEDDLSNDEEEEVHAALPIGSLATGEGALMRNIYNKNLMVSPEKNSLLKDKDIQSCLDSYHFYNSSSHQDLDYDNLHSYHVDDYQSPSSNHQQNSSTNSSHHTTSLNLDFWQHSNLHNNSISSNNDSYNLKPFRHKNFPIHETHSSFPPYSNRTFESKDHNSAPFDLLDPITIPSMTQLPFQPSNYSNFEPLNFYTKPKLNSISQQHPPHTPLLNKTRKQLPSFIKTDNVGSSDLHSPPLSLQHTYYPTPFPSSNNSPFPSSSNGGNQLSAKNNPTQIPSPYTTSSNTFFPPTSNPSYSSSTNISSPEKIDQFHQQHPPPPPPPVPPVACDLFNDFSTKALRFSTTASNVMLDDLENKDKLGKNANSFQDFSTRPPPTLPTTSKITKDNNNSVVNNINNNLMHSEQQQHQLQKKKNTNNTNNFEDDFESDGLISLLYKPKTFLGNDKKYFECACEWFEENGDPIQKLEESSGQREFLCETCQRSFLRKQDLRRHIVNTHQREKKSLKCPK